MVLKLSNVFLQNRFADESLTRGVHGFVCNGCSARSKSLARSRHLFTENCWNLYYV